MNSLAYKNPYDIIHPDRKPMRWKVTPTTSLVWSYRSQPDYIEKFDAVVAQWRDETVAMSSVGDMMALASFKAITAVGEKALPLIYRHLQKQPSLLVIAGIAITGENPTPKSAQGNIPKIVAAWLRWAERTGVFTD